MLDSLDSRALRQADCYGQRFMKPGTYAYHVLQLGGDKINSERPFTVKVVEAKPKQGMGQAAVSLSFKDGMFAPHPAEVTIEAGDMVLWNCQDRGAPPYVVVGEKEFFASNRLVNESGYSHAFGVAGEYPWVDAFGSGARGVIKVRDPGCKDAASLQQWQKSLSKGALVTVTGTKAEPESVEIVVGQTVFFAVTKGPGISITDKRLVR